MTTDGGPGRELPRLGLLREMTNGAVLEQVFARGRVTRAELSALTGISEPTISQSVRRLRMRTCCGKRVPTPDAEAGWPPSTSSPLTRDGFLPFRSTKVDWWCELST